MTHLIHKQLRPLKSFARNNELKGERMSTIRASHILVDHEHEAQDLIAKLGEGVTFADLAAKFSKCPSGKSGGDLGEFGKGQMVGEFEEAAFALEKEKF